MTYSKKSLILMGCFSFPLSAMDYANVEKQYQKFMLQVKTSMAPSCYEAFLENKDAAGSLIELIASSDGMPKEKVAVAINSPGSRLWLEGYITTNQKAKDSLESNLLHFAQPYLMEHKALLLKLLEVKPLVENVGKQLFESACKNNNFECAQLLYDRGIMSDDHQVLQQFLDSQK